MFTINILYMPKNDILITRLMIFLCVCVCVTCLLIMGALALRSGSGGGNGWWSEGGSAGSKQKRHMAGWGHADRG